MPALNSSSSSRNQHSNPNVENELVTWYKSIPAISRVILSSIMALALLSALNIIDPRLLILDYVASIKKFQLWRLVTSCLFMSFGPGFIFQMYFLYNYATRLEESYFAGRKADMAWFLILNILTLDAIAIAFNFPVVTMGFVMSLVYLWSQANSDEIVTFFFGLQFKALYLPLVMIGFDVLSGSFSIVSIAGIFSAHVYWYLQEVLPGTNGANPTSSGNQTLKTPSILYQVFPQEEVRGEFTADGVTRVARATGRNENQSLHGRWGKGRRLGE